MRKNKSLFRPKFQTFQLSGKIGANIFSIEQSRRMNFFLNLVRLYEGGHNQIHLYNKQLATVCLSGVGA